MPKPKQWYSYVDDWTSLWEPDLEAIVYGATCDPTRVDPKVLQWAKQNCSHKPHFIKIVNMNAVDGRPALGYGLGNASGCQLSVPKPFVKEHFQKLQRVVTLENDEGKTWRVSFGAARTDHRGSEDGIESQLKMTSNLGKSLYSSSWETPASTSHALTKMATSSAAKTALTRHLIQLPPSRNNSSP